MNRNRKKVNIPAEVRKKCSADYVLRGRVERMTLPKSARAIVRSYVADIDRRAKELKGDKISDEVRERFREIDSAIANGAMAADPYVRTIILYDIANIIGYEKSAANNFMSRKAYYMTKDRVETRIAINLHIFG